MIVYQVLTMVGHHVHCVCPDKKAGQFIRTAVHDFEGDQTYTEKLGHNFTLNATFAEIKAADYDALVIPGGRAAEYLRLNERHCDRPPFRRAQQADRRHLPRHATVDVNRRVKGRSCTAYPAVGPEITMAGGKYVESADRRAYVDGNLVTAPAWPAQPAWLGKFLKVLGSKIEP